MTIFELLKDWDSVPWLNTDVYTPLQIGLFFTGAVLWMGAYVDTAVNIVKKKTVAIPMAAVVLNFGWEVAASIFFVPNMGKLLVLAYWVWMLLDIFIFASLYKYGDKQMVMPYFKKHIKFYLTVGIIISFLSQLFFMLEYDLPMAPVSGYIINLAMSIGFLYLLFVPGFEGNTKVTAWCKFLGTGIISIMFALHYPGNWFLIVMYFSVALFDIMYIVMLNKKLKGKLN